MGERIALGFCNNVDYEIVWNAEVVAELVGHYRIRADELNAFGAIDCERDLLLSILDFMRTGEGGERFVGDSAIIEGFGARFEKAVTLGGTSVRAAIAMRKLGYTSALHLITLNDQVRRLIPADSPYVCSNAEDSLYPHLIVQFGAGDRVRAGEIDILARQPNRLIYHCNADRIAMRINEEFSDLIGDARVLLVSGFNAMQDKRLLSERLASVIKLLERLPHGASVYLEDGGYFDPSYRRLIYRTLGTRISIYSMNEDELQDHLGRPVALDDAAEVCAAVSALKRRMSAGAVVVHTQHWALACGDGVRRYKTALKAGVALATTRFRHGDGFTLAQYREIENAAPSEQNASFAEAINFNGGGKCICVPVAAVDQHNATTIGLGDAFVGGFLPALLD
jgi:ADP-dependent phosphofructokinase/glucokinase